MTRFLILSLVIISTRKEVNIMNSIIGLIIIAFGLGYFIDEQKPLNLPLELKNGDIIETFIFKNNMYYCPLYCKSQHAHIAHFSNQKCEMAELCYHFVHPELPNLATIKNDQNIFSQKCCVWFKIRKHYILWF